MRILCPGIAIDPNAGVLCSFAQDPAAKVGRQEFSCVRNRTPGLGIGTEQPWFCFKYIILLGRLEGFMNQRWMRRVQVGGMVLGSVIVLTAADTGTLPKPPVAKKVPHVSEV